MRTTVDIPDDLYRELKSRAGREGTTVKQLILQGVQTALGPPKPLGNKSRLKLPLIRSKRPGSLKLGKEGVYEYIPFP